MPSYTTTVAPTITTSAIHRLHRRPTILHLRGKSDVQTQPKPRYQLKTASSDRDFYLDTFFNPVWMSGQHVFSFAEDGRVVGPVNKQKCHPGYHTTTTTRTDTSVGTDLTDKPWKNVAITEQDDAEFAALVVGLVYTWPPPSSLGKGCAECEVSLGSPRPSAGAGAEVEEGEGRVQRNADRREGALLSEFMGDVFRVVPGRQHGDVLRMKDPVEVERLEVWVGQTLTPLLPLTGEDDAEEFTGVVENELVYNLRALLKVDE